MTFPWGATSLNILLVCDLERDRNIIRNYINRPVLSVTSQIWIIHIQHTVSCLSLSKYSNLSEAEELAGTGCRCDIRASFLGSELQAHRELVLRCSSWQVDFGAGGPFTCVIRGVKFLQLARGR